MLKKAFFVSILLFLPINPVLALTTSEFPSLPPENQNELKVAIVQTQKNYKENDIEQLLENYPKIKKRYIFEEVFTGFSVEGPISELEKLKKNQLVTMVTTVQQYSIENENPIELIEADSIRESAKSISHLSGKGIKVGVIDTGLDYRHPDLEGNYRKGWDFVDNDEDPMETKGLGKKDTLHGTHVAGIIAANGKIKGVAPNAEIFAYRALGPGGAGTTEQILAAIEKAVKDKVDIINLSLGSDVNGPDLPISLALNKVVEKGIIAIAAAGNSGPEDWTVGSPGTASEAISVGASTPNIYTPIIYLDKQRIALSSMKNSENWTKSETIQLMDGGIGSERELVGAKGKVALIKRGEITFSEKVKNAYKKGAEGVIIYNNSDGPFQGMLEKKASIPVAVLSKKEGELLLQRGSKQPFRMKVEMEWEKDILADFSSRGPVTRTWDIKPDVIAPGVVINSTVPGGYVALQGTSMAAPHVAGACALILEAHPNWKPDEVKAALMNTAKRIKNRNNQDYKVYEQGAGRIQVEQAINVDVLVMPGSIRFGKYKMVKEKKVYQATVTLKNVGSKQEKISFDHPKGMQGLDWKLPMADTLNAGETKTLPISIEINSDYFQKELQDGTICVWTGNKSVQIPYLFVISEPDYPRIMGFDMVRKEENTDLYEYETYLPTGAEEFGIALFRDDTLQFVQYLDWKRSVKRGTIKGKFHLKVNEGEGIYRIKVFAKKAGKEDILEKIVKIK
ncbi:S8 family serine peptidase [Bacillus sp. B1-b2]|uniref:S8 family serine peptidase n=1 Tax=Bacillus sp. B1-b2 TaxID=2653201 RepID=UPI0012625278|nr:S8 family serine peptidase [Bacillus sp. B1-b2]KAB7671832.1 S8 family serine peptidase [Bacillus sp. B1-b2]